MTETQRAAMRQALDILDSEFSSVGGDICRWCDGRLLSKRHNCKLEQTITALRAALAEPQPEPVAWATEIIDALQAQYDTEMIQENDSGDALIRLDQAIAAVEYAEKYYTAPPARRPLTPAQEAAPELLEALQDLCDTLGECGMTEKARAAIAKATGGNDE